MRILRSDMRDSLLVHIVMLTATYLSAYGNVSIYLHLGIFDPALNTTFPLSVHGGGGS